MFLEDKAIEEQFLLSDLTEYIEVMFSGKEKIDWTTYRHRKYLVNVLAFVTDKGMLKINDFSDRNFASYKEAEVLYENTGLSKYFVRHFMGNIMNYNTAEDLERDEWLDGNLEKGVSRRNRVYRKVVLSPAVYNEGVEDADYLYIKNYRGMIQDEIEKYFDSELHVHKSATFMILSNEKSYKRSFPELKAISDITLQMNRIIIDNLSKGELEKAEYDVIKVSRYYFDKMVEELREKHIAGWSKEFRDMKVEKLTEELIKYMVSYLFIKKDVDDIFILPLVGKITGRYPDEFIKSLEGSEKNGEI
jgi:uncharacterized protein (TIGR02678 family)